MQNVGNVWDISAKSWKENSSIPDHVEYSQNMKNRYKLACVSHSLPSRNLERLLNKRPECGAPGGGRDGGGGGQGNLLKTL